MEITFKQNYAKNDFAKFYLKEVNLCFQLLFLDLIYNLKPEKYEYYVEEFKIYDTNDSAEIDISQKKPICSFKINSNKSEYNIKLKKEIHDPCCFYQYFNITLVFKNSKGIKNYITYMIPLYYDKINVIYSLFYNYGYKSFEIIIRKETFDIDDFMPKEPSLVFINENKCIKITSKEKFENNACQKRFLFININSYESFPNLNLGKYRIFKYSTSISPSHITVYLDEDFNHIGFYDFKIDSLKENIIKFSYLEELYNDCLQFKNIIMNLKEAYQKRNYKFYDTFYKKIDSTLNYININENVENNYNLFLRQKIESLKDKGKNLIFYYSYVKLFYSFQKNNIDKEYFDRIVTMFETFQNSIKDKFILKNDENQIDEVKLIYFLSGILRSYSKDDYVEKIKEYETNQLANSNLIDLIDFKENNIYSFVEKNNNDIIDNLNTNSYLFYILNQFNSSIGKNMIIANYSSSGNSECSMMSMITLENLKKEFKSIKQRWGIKIGFQTVYRAVTDIITKITCYNEKELFGNFKKERKIEEDPNFNQRFILSMNMKHERFCHTLVSINIFTGNLKGSPEEYLDFENKTKIKLVSDDKHESGNAFEYLITRNKYFIHFLRFPIYHKNLEKFLDVNIWTKNTMAELNVLINEFIENYIYKRKKINKLDKSKKQKKDDSEFNSSKNLKICKNNYCDIFKKK